ncbi:Spindle pole body component alp14 [Golovinomyces cichoracearum]|uniref:Spindle pole body component alp14 n=1 Tax=Golovinomyces cichoracearum TaxID=62708 RepID=A0A420J4Z4_9PEZI|nr:Spindle pole body component alp14 [Golovinomyces cichoracearum]
MAEQEDDYNLLPLSDRFQHKVWKVRKAAYEDATKQFEITPDEFDPVFRPFNQDPTLWKGAVADSNVAAQQSGIAALCAFLKFGSKENCTRSRGYTLNSLVEKGLASAKANTKASSLEAILLYIELDTAAPVVEELIPSLSNKQPKIVAATLAALTAIYHNYGCKVVDPKPALKTLPKAFGHADKNVRAEATNLAVEFYRWLREAMKPIFWGDLKSTQQTDMEAQFERIKAEPAPKQERYLRSQQSAIAKNSASSEAGVAETEDEADEPAEIDVFSMVEPQDVLSKIQPDFIEQVSSTKWKDRKDALESAYTVLNIPKIKDGDFSEIVRALAKCMKDPNIAVVTQAAQCIEALAKGLRKQFGKYRSVVCGPIMERMKEKKASVSDALAGALDQVFLATSLTENLEEILENLKHKNPQVKEGTMRFLIRCLKTTREPPTKQEVSSIAEAAKKLLAESSETLRAGGAEVLGTLMKIMGERAMGPHLESLDDIRKTKVREFFETAEVKAKDKPKQPPPAVVNRVVPSSAPRKNLVKKLAVKKPAPPPSVYAQEQTSTPQITTKSSTSSKVGGQKPPSLNTPNLKAPTKRTIAVPGGAASPRRAASQAPSSEEEVPPAPRIGLSRGLAGRSLVAKAPIPLTISSNSLSPPSSSGLISSEKAELEELRLENDRLTRQNDELRQEHSRLNSEIQEFKNETAKMIEDRARDSLSIIAKETQLVRARSDCEAAEAMCGQLRREMERLKRALATSERVKSPTVMSPNRDRTSDESNVHNDSEAQRNLSDSRQSFNRSRFSYTSVPGDEKENGDRFSTLYRNKVNPDSAHNSRLNGRNSPSPLPSLNSFHSSRSVRDTGTDNFRSEAGQGMESWKRAAEVTSALKAKIEQMKARQGIPRS